MNLKLDNFTHEFVKPSVSLYDLFHSGVTEPSKVVSFNDVDGQYNGIKEVQSIRFLKIHLESAEEAKRRAFILALLTYNTNTHTFVRLYDKDKTLKDPYFITGLKQFWKSMFINPPKNLVPTSNQSHNGFILSAEERKLV
jgi:hypothetical protein